MNRIIAPPAPAKLAARMGLAAAAIACLCNGTVHAADLIVTTNHGGFVLDGACSLAEAVTVANTDTANADCPAGDGWDRILFALPATTITLTSTLFVTDDLSIVGPGADQLEISGGDTVRILQVSPGVSLLVDSVTLSHGASAAGGAISLAPGTSSTIVDSALRGNTATNSGGAIHVDNDTGLTASPEIVILRSVFSNNESQGPAAGGALRVGINSRLTVRDSTFVDNEANDSGLPNSGVTSGAISIFGAQSAVIERSTFSDNTVTGTSPSVAGGAIRISAGGGLNSVVTIRETTITANKSTGDGGGLQVLGAVSVELINSIVAGNTAEIAPDLHKAGTTETIIGTTSFIGNNQTVTVEFPAGSPHVPSGNYAGTSAAPLDPGLEFLGDVGGPTPSQMPMSGATVVDAGTCPDAAADQRGFAGTGGRVVGSACDIGSVELNAVDTQPIFSSSFEVGVTHRWR